jgi:hypothetical protein
VGAVDAEAVVVDDERVSVRAGVATGCAEVPQAAVVTGLLAGVDPSHGGFLRLWLLRMAAVCPAAAPHVRDGTRSTAVWQTGQ